MTVVYLVQYENGFVPFFKEDGSILDKHLLEALYAKSFGKESQNFLSAYLIYQFWAKNIPLHSVGKIARWGNNFVFTILTRKVLDGALIVSDDHTDLTSYNALLQHQPENWYIVDSMEELIGLTAMEDEPVTPTTSTARTAKAWMEFRLYGCFK